MLFYPSKNNNKLNTKPFQPDLITGRAMVNPHYKVTVERDAKIIVDSGAFQEDGIKRRRVTPEQALNRQLAYEQRLQAIHGDDWHFEAVVTYDQMFGVDEHVIDGKKVKKRGTLESATHAIAETIKSAEYYASQRSYIQGKIAFASQGINPDQYLGCVLALLDLMYPSDWLAFGGFCIIGKVPRLKPVFYETLERVIPVAKRHNITRFHVLGVTVNDSIAIANSIAKRHGVTISTDSSSIEINSIMGRVMNKETGHWANVYSKAEKYVQYWPCELAHQNIEAYDTWCWNGCHHRIVDRYNAIKHRQLVLGI